MPSKEQLRSVGQSCSRYNCNQGNQKRSCESCVHWFGEDGMCELNIFLEQLESLDQT